ncbi:hypothetical protein [Microbacterium deminutum]|uniref:ABC transporter permease n=1 Tax=Microbacterium deminutum TaxID=344164 RepID=A0ABP5CCE1_9MICO
MINRQRALAALSVLTRTVIIIAVVGVVLGAVIWAAGSASYGAIGLQVLGTVLLSIGAGMVPIAFIVGAINLHAQAVVPEAVAFEVSAP